MCRINWLGGQHHICLAGSDSRLGTRLSLSFSSLVWNGLGVFCWTFFWRRRRALHGRLLLAKVGVKFLVATAGSSCKRDACADLQSKTVRVKRKFQTQYGIAFLRAEAKRLLDISDIRASRATSGLKVEGEPLL